MRGMAQNAARALAGGRIVFGLTMLAAPQLAARWIGQAAHAPGALVIIRAFGARDAALGIGTLASASEPAQLRRWLVASSACDAVDFAATLAGPRAPARAPILVLASGATIAGLSAAAAL